MNILFLTEIAPFPINGGEKLRTYGLLKLMSELKLNVQAITSNSPTDGEILRNFPNVHFYGFNFDKFRSVGRLARYRYLFCCDEELLNLIRHIMHQTPIDVAYIDYHLYGQYIPFFKKAKIPVIYGTHNAQARLIFQQPYVSFRNRVSKFVDYVMNRLHEIYFLRKADALIVVSEQDKKYHQILNQKGRIAVIPNFLVETEYLSEGHKKENYILMSANFYAFQNSFGLEWFLKEVWNRDLWEKTKLILVGRGSKELFELLKQKYVCTNIQVIGEVADLRNYIARAQVSIVPLLHGSGSRLKCLESMALKTQLISTSKGAEGIDHDHSIIIADTPETFRNELIANIENKTNYTDRAYDAFMAKYSLKPNMDIFNKILNTLAEN